MWHSSMPPAVNCLLPFSHIHIYYRQEVDELKERGREHEFFNIKFALHIRGDLKWKKFFYPSLLKRSDHLTLPFGGTYWLLTKFWLTVAVLRSNHSWRFHACDTEIETISFTNALSSSLPPSAALLIQLRFFYFHFLSLLLACVGFEIKAEISHSEWFEWLLTVIETSWDNAAAKGLRGCSALQYAQLVGESQRRKNWQSDR